MSTTPAIYSAAENEKRSLAGLESRRLFGAAFVLAAVGACLLSGWAPLGFSIAAVFLFAGPHNWMEARYFMSRMPSRWGRLWFYYAAGLGGVFVLGALSLVIPAAGRAWKWERADFLFGVALWNTLLVAWIVGMVTLRRKELKRDRWPFVVPGALALLSLNWMWPLAWSLGLVYLHPLVAMWFLDRELAKRQPHWHATYRRCLWLVPVLLVALWWRLAGKADLPGQDLLTMQITHHAGSGVLTGVSSHLLVATHAFLEMLHYLVWIVAIPLITYKAAPWKLAKVPLAARSGRWKIALAGVLGLGLVVVVCLWAGFMANYPLTRDIYFGIAILHVLAEVPFLLRLL